MSIGQKILELRTANNLSQGDLAEKLDVSRQSVSKWETDSSVPDLEKLMKLCDVFGVSLDELTNRVSAANEQTDKTAADYPYTNNVYSLKEKPNMKHIVGIVLLAVGLISIILGILFTVILIGFGLYIVVCGVLCLCVKKRLRLSLVIFTAALLLIVLLFIIVYLRSPTPVVQETQQPLLMALIMANISL